MALYQSELGQVRWVMSQSVNSRSEAGSRADSAEEASSEPKGHPAAKRRRSNYPRAGWTEDAKANITYLRGRAQALRQRGFDQSDAGCHRAGQLNCLPSENGGKVRAERSPIRSAAEFESVCHSVDELLDEAWQAASGEDPKYARWVDWWYGTCVEATYKNLHYAEATIVRLYSPIEVRYAIRDALRVAGVVAVMLQGRVEGCYLYCLPWK
jgi:hypothetical protein